MAIFRKFTKRIFILANVLVVALFLLACSNAIPHPGTWWTLSLLGLLFPLFLLLVVGFLVFWLFFHSKQLSLISLAALILGWSNIHAFFALSPHRSFQAVKPANTLRLLTWNVHSWDEFITRKPGASGHRAGMMEFIRSQNADVMCFQEFFEPRNYKSLQPNIAYISKELNYPYYYFSRDFESPNKAYQLGVILFSRFPILDSALIKYENPFSPKAAESLVQADLDVNGRRIRLFTTHLQSVLFQRKDFRNVEIIKNVEDSVLEASKSVVKKLKRAYTLRASQADLVREELDKSPLPAIICGDFNDVPNSYTYFRIRGDRRDAFMAGGLGIGRTYVHLSPTLRIDYIMTDRSMKVIQCDRFPLPYSDHYPVMADIRIP